MNPSRPSSRASMSYQPDGQPLTYSSVHEYGGDGDTSYLSTTSNYGSGGGGPDMGRPSPAAGHSAALLDDTDDKHSFARTPAASASSAPTKRAKRYFSPSESRAGRVAKTALRSVGLALAIAVLGIMVHVLVQHDTSKEGLLPQTDPATGMGNNTVRLWTRSLVIFPVYLMLAAAAFATAGGAALLATYLVCVPIDIDVRPVPDASSVSSHRALTLSFSRQGTEAAQARTPCHHRHRHRRPGALDRGAGLLQDVRHHRPTGLGHLVVELHPQVPDGQRRHGAHVRRAAGGLDRRRGAGGRRARKPRPGRVGCVEDGAGGEVRQVAGLKTWWKRSTSPRGSHCLP